MRSLPGRRHLRDALSFSPGPDRRRVALKAGITCLLLLGGAQLAGDLRFGMLATLGSFTVLYGATAPARYRLTLLSLVAAGLVGSATIGALTAHSPWIDVLALAGTAGVTTFLCFVFRVGPPGAMFFVLVHGVAALASRHGTPMSTIVLAVLVGAVLAVVGGMSDLVVHPRGPEEKAVAAAEAAMDAFEAESDRGTLPVVRSAASGAMHRAWTTVADAGSHPRFTSRLWQVQTRYTAASARITGVELGLHPAPWGSPSGDEDADREAMAEQEAAADAWTSEPTRRRIESEQIWDSSLGRPAAGPVLRRAVQWPSEPLLVVTRVLVATLVAGTIARLIDVEHIHWTVAFATLVLHQGGTRDAQTVRAVQRFGGTIVGLGMFLLLQWADPRGWALVIVIAVLQAGIELVVARNYGLAVIAITPLALTIGLAASPGVPAAALAAERALDTVIAVGVALVTLHLVGRRAGVPILRSYARHVVHGIEAVLGDVRSGRLQTGAARENRRRLYHALLESEEFALRTHADEPERLQPYREMEAAVSDLGYVVLGMAWHPDARRAGRLAHRADRPLRRILAHPLTVDRPAADIHDDVLALRAAVAAAVRGDSGDPAPDPRP